MANTEDAGKSPSQFAESHIKQIAKEGKVIEITEVIVTCHGKVKVRD